MRSAQILYNIDRKKERTKIKTKTRTKTQTKTKTETMKERRAKMACGKCITCTQKIETLPRQGIYRMTKIVTETKTMIQMQKKEGEDIE